MHFPFERGPTYTMADLRAFEQRLSQARKKDRALSNVWRIAKDEKMKRWIKIREGTYPIKLLADHKGYADDATFTLKPYGHRGNRCRNMSRRAKRSIFKLLLRTRSGPIRAITVQHGGYDHRLTLAALNRDGVLHGSGRLRRRGKEIISELPLTSVDDDRAACVKGLLGALIRKSNHRGEPCRLLIYGRTYLMHLIDSDFEGVVRSSMAEFCAGGGTICLSSGHTLLMRMQAALSNTLRIINVGHAPAPARRTTRVATKITSAPSLRHRDCRTRCKAMHEALLAPSTGHTTREQLDALCALWRNFDLAALILD